MTFFKLLLLDSAADWLDQQPSAVSGNFDRLRQAFEEHYKTPDIMKHIAAKEIFNRRQKADENVEDYIVSMRRLAKMIASDNKITSFAILNGLKPHISIYVTQHKPETIQQILEADKIAAITTPATIGVDTSLSEQLADVQLEVRQLASKWDRITTASVSGSRSSSPAQDRRVTFQTPPQRENVQGNPRSMGSGVVRPRSVMNQPVRFRTSGTTSSMPSFRGRSRFGQMGPRPQQCFRCGRVPHPHPNQCPAITKTCNYCLKRGHFSIACRGALRARSMQQGRNE